MSDAALTKWMRQTVGPANIRGHRLTVAGDGRWCKCGKYLGGLGNAIDSEGRRTHEGALTPADRFALHLVDLHNKNGGPRS
jgi:hypothetical protein